MCWNAVGASEQHAGDGSQFLFACSNRGHVLHSIWKQPQSGRGSSLDFVEHVVPTRTQHIVPDEQELLLRALPYGL